MKTNGYITITAAQNGYTCSADAGATQITFAPNAQGERAFEQWVLDALAALKDYRQAQQRHTSPTIVEVANAIIPGWDKDDWNVMHKIGTNGKDN